MKAGLEYYCEDDWNEELDSETNLKVLDIRNMEWTKYVYVQPWTILAA